MTDGSQVPKRKFMNPEDATTWMVIRESRYWNDRLNEMLNITTNVGKKLEEMRKIDDGNSSSSAPEDSSKEEFHQIPFSQILHKRQKPNLFGNSPVSLSVLSMPGPSFKNETSLGKKRVRDDSKNQEDGSAKRKK